MLHSITLLHNSQLSHSPFFPGTLALRSVIYKENPCRAREDCVMEFVNYMGSEAGPLLAGWLHDSETTIGDTGGCFCGSVLARSPQVSSACQVVGRLRRTWTFPFQPVGCAIFLRVRDSSISVLLQRTGGPFVVGITIKCRGYQTGLSGHLTPSTACSRIIKYATSMQES